MISLKDQTKSLKIKAINQENSENHFNLGIKKAQRDYPCAECLFSGKSIKSG
jgi:hypothetical protein